MLRVAVSIKAGTMAPSTILRRLGSASAKKQAVLGREVLLAWFRQRNADLRALSPFPVARALPRLVPSGPSDAMLAANPLVTAAMR